MNLFYYYICLIVIFFKYDTLLSVCLIFGVRTQTQVYFTLKISNDV